MTDETISNVPVLILGNKIDRPEAISEDALRGMFGLHGHTTGKVMNTYGIRMDAIICYIIISNNIFIYRLFPYFSSYLK